MTATCSGCNGLGVARDFIVPIPSELSTSTHINSAYMYMTDVWSASCTAEPVQLCDHRHDQLVNDLEQPAQLLDRPAEAVVRARVLVQLPVLKNNVTWNVTSVVQG